MINYVHIVQENARVKNIIVQIVIAKQIIIAMKFVKLVKNALVKNIYVYLDTAIITIIDVHKVIIYVENRVIFKNVNIYAIWIQIISHF